MKTLMLREEELNVNTKASSYNLNFSIHFSVVHVLIFIAPVNTDNWEKIKIVTRRFSNAPTCLKFGIWFLSCNIKVLIS